ncbi:MAG TPA: MarR family winged helix-turn-helix transcriptional regulator [Pyrinomonadaceae bacterium]
MITGRDSDYTTISGLAQAVKRLGEELGDPEMPLQRALIFLIIAESGDAGMDQKRLVRATGLSSSAVSRHVQALGRLNRFRKPGLDVVETRLDQTDWRAKPIFLTTKGKTVAGKLTDR